MIDVIVTRHPALLEYLREIGLADDQTEVVAHVTPEKIEGKHVCGVLPHHLSALTASFTEIPLSVPADLRGVELSLEQIRKFAGKPATYRVMTAEKFTAGLEKIADHAFSGGYWAARPEEFDLF